MEKPTEAELLELLTFLVEAINSSAICEDEEFTIVDGYIHGIEKLDRAREIVKKLKEEKR